MDTSNLLPVTQYILSSFAPSVGSASTAHGLPLVSPSIPTEVEETVLQTSAWAGPSAGHFITQLGGNALVPGTPVGVAVRACNALGCGSNSEGIILSTESGAPGRTLPPTLVSLNATSVTVRCITPAEYTGGAPIVDYELRYYTKPVLFDEIVSLGANLPTTFVLPNRLLSHECEQPRTHHSQYPCYLPASAPEYHIHRLYIPCLSLITSTRSVCRCPSCARSLQSRRSRMV